MKKLGLALLGLLLALPVQAQSVQQSGSVIPGQSTYWISNGIVGNGGNANDSSITSLGVTNNTVPGFCVSSGRSTAAGRQQLCLGAPLNSAAQITLQNYGTATPQNLQFVINGTVVTIPTGGGSVIPAITLPLVNGQTICSSGTAGILAGCVGTTNTIPYWTSSTLLGATSAAASSVLITSPGNVPSLSQTLPLAVQGNITSVGTITSGVWAGTPITVTGGGTGAATLTANGVLLGNGTSPVTSIATASVGLCILSNGGSPPTWGACSSGAGSAAGANTQVQFNNSSALGGSPNLTWVSPLLTIGQNAVTSGQLGLANGGAAGATTTIQSAAATIAYNFNLPNGAGTSGQPLLSGGGGSSAMTFGTLSAGAGGTSCSVASGTCLDNITAFSSTGFINRTGAGTYSFSPQIGLANGGTSANLTASNGGIFYSTASAGAILSGTATANQMLLSGANSAPAWSTATHPATTTINQILYSSSANVIAGLATGNNGALITSAGGVPSISSTLPSAVQANITTTGTVGTGVWQGTPVALLYGGTNAALTASNGGIFYSTASAGAILAGTATANLPLLSAANTTPAWAGVSYPTSATSGGIPYFSSTSAMASSALLTANQIMIGGGSGTAPTTFACATSTTIVHGGTPPTCGQLVNGDITTNTIANASLAQAGAATIKMNATSGTANVSDNTIQGLTDIGTLSTTLDWLVIYDHVAGTLKKTNAAEIAAGVGGGVTSLTPGNGLVSSLTAACSQSAITTTGTLSAAECVNAQTGTSYGIADGDRAKLVTASNAAAQAYSIAQAGAANAFQTGWFTEVKNVSTNAAGVVTITPTTSTINGNSTFKLYPGQTARIVSDGTDYQTSTIGVPNTLPTVSLVTTTAHSGGFGANASGTYTTPANALWIEIELVGGGSGGTGNVVPVAGNASCWNTSGAACTTPVYSAGGAAASATGGTISGSSTCSIAALAGANGQGGVGGQVGTSSSGGIGGSSVLGGAGAGVIGSAGTNAAADSGSGGGGGGTASVVANTSTGGGAGATCRTIINSPAGTYTFVVGAKGTGGAAGGNIQAGGDGAGGRITVIEHYGS